MIKKNSRHTVEIKEATAKGFGVAHIGEYVVFVDGGLPGDTAEVHLVKAKKRYGYGKILKILTPSPFRKDSPCPVSEICGGCQWQHCEYSAQLGFKKDIVKNALERIGGQRQSRFSPTERDGGGTFVSKPDNVIAADFPYRYRNKAVFPIVPSGGADGFTIGMYAPRSHRIVEVSDCIIQHEAHVKILAALKTHMRTHKITAYDETAHRGIMRHIMVRTSLFSGEVMVVLVANLRAGRGFSGQSFPAADEFAAALKNLGVTTLLLNRNNSRGNTILGDDFEILYGDGFITEKIGEIKYRLSAPSFFQVNPTQTKILYETAIAQAALTGEETVIDAHCGVGGVALFAARHAKSVLGTDIVQAAITDAEKNAELNGITNAKFICGAAEEVIPRLLAGEGIEYGVAFLDPPRKGCEKPLLDALIAAKIPKVVYISCDPATLARDVKILTDGGYVLETVQPVDLFPHTCKVEVCCSLRNTE